MPLDATGFTHEVIDDLATIAIAPERVKIWEDYILDCFAAQSEENAFLVAEGKARWALSLSSHHVREYIRLAPRDVRRLAERVKAENPDVRFSIGWFDEDPILYANRRGASHCLAIWYNGVVRAIADGAKLSLIQRFRRRLAKIV